MTHKNAVLELALFTVKPGYESRMPALRSGLREALKGFEGLIEFAGFSPLEQGRAFADLAWWADIASAQRVAEAFEQGDPRFAPYAEAIESLMFMGYLQPE